MSFRQRNILLILYWICAVVCNFYCSEAGDSIQQSRCLKPVPIQIPQCQNTFYKFTGMPNLVGQDNQLDARHQLQTFKPLITYKCSNRLNFFLCSVYTPMCDVNTRYLIGPCRPLCEHVKARCAPVLRVFDFDWPANLNCSRFPVKNVVGGEMCMEGPQDAEDTPLPFENAVIDLQEKTGENENTGTVDDDHNRNQESDVKNSNVKVTDDEQLVSSWIKQFAEFQSINHKPEVERSHMNRQASAISIMAQSLRHCAHLKKPTSYIYVNRTGRCAPLCQADILFSPDAKALSMVWTSVLTGICGIVTALTLLGYLLYSSQFRLTERPVIYITLCQLIYSLGFVLSLGLGPKTVTCGPDLDSGREVRLQEGLDNSVCALVFMVQYFFSIASSMWWSLLTVHWALQYSQCWCSLCWEPVDSYDDYTSLTASDTECCPWFGHQLCQCLPDEQWEKENLNVLSERQVEHNPPPQQSNSKPPVFTHQPNHRAADVADTAPNGGSGMTNLVCDKSLKSFPPSRLSETVSYYTQNGKIVPAYRYLTNSSSNNANIAHQARIRQIRGAESYEQISVCLAREHVLVWLTAALLTVGVLVSRQVDADELIPVCSVGRQNTRAMGVFVVGPEVIVTVFGLISLLAGLLFGLIRRHCRRHVQRTSSEQVIHHRIVPDINTIGNAEAQTSENSRLLCNNSVNSNVNPVGCTQTPVAVKCEPRKMSRKQSHVSRKVEVRTAVDSLERRIGLFCFLYLLPLLCVTTCNLYEYLCRDLWLRDKDYKPTGSSSTLSFPPKLWKPDEVVGPNPDIFLLRIFMSLVPGFTCSLWTWSVKGCKPWTRLYSRLRYLTMKCFRLKNSSEQIETSLKFDFIHADQRHTSQALAREAHLYSVSSHPYAVYQYRVTGNSASTNGCAKLANNMEPCMVETTSPPNGIETQNSSATTPGYYSQAKVGSTIEPHMSDTLSEESPIPPPLPSTSRPHLPVRGDPCIGASSNHVSGVIPPTGLSIQS